MLPSNTVGNSYSMGVVLSFVVVATDMPDGACTRAGMGSQEGGNAG